MTLAVQCHLQCSVTCSAVSRAVQCHLQCNVTCNDTKFSRLKTEPFQPCSGMNHTRNFSRGLLIVTVSLRIFDQHRSSRRVSQSPLFYLGSSRRRDFLAPRLISAHHFVSLTWEGRTSRKGSLAALASQSMRIWQGRAEARKARMKTSC